MSALGGLIADLRNDFIRTLFPDLDQGTEALGAPMAELEATGRQWLAGQGYAGPVQIRVSADMRCAGQSYEIETPPQACWITKGDGAAIARAFHAEHERLFGHASQNAPIQIVNLRLVASGATPKPQVRKPTPATAPVAPSGHITGWLDGRAHQPPLYTRASLHPGHRLTGPVVIGPVVIGPALDDAFRAAGFARDVSIQVATSVAAAPLVAAGLGVALVDGLTDWPGLIRRPFRPKVTMGLAAATDSARPISRLAKPFLVALRVGI